MADKVDVVAPGLHLLEADADRQKMHMPRGVAQLDAAPENLMAEKTARYRYQIAVDPDIAAESKLYKSISLDLVFRSPQLQQLDHKADRVLGELFQIFCDNYLGGRVHPLRLLPPETEAALADAPDRVAKARVICDTLAKLTDRFAIRTYRRLVDPEFGSIVDLV